MTIPHWLLALCLTPLTTPAQAQADERVSSFGVYVGYGDAVYDDFVRESFYIQMRDGVELACDLYRPSKGGVMEEGRLPLVWTHDRYHRAAQAGDGALPTKVMTYPFLRPMIERGYLVAAVDVRGGGASFGNWYGIFNEEETKDAYEIIEWFAAQEWCDGNIGMYGGSYLGGTQFMAASQKPPHLKALFPWVAPCDMYEITWSGGIYRDDLCTIWGQLTHMLDRSPAVASVDWDDGGALKKEALAAHEENRPFEPVVRSLPFRDSEYRDRKHWIVQSPLSYVQEIEESEVAVYHEGGWFDPFSRDAFVMYENLDNPQKLIMGPWFHAQAHGVNWQAEAMRWFDYWLKGIENGVMEDDPIHYFTIGAPEGKEWRSTKEWPLPNETRVAYTLHDGKSGSIESVNDGLLLVQEEEPGQDAYTVDYGTSSGRISRWNTAVGLGGPNPEIVDQRSNDERCLTYTTPVLEADVEVTGHPLLHLWVSMDAPDGDFFAYLEEVTPEGGSQYVTEGCLRVSHRRLADPPYDYLDLPYHPCTEDGTLPASDEPMELVFDLFPISNVFDAGNRLRVTIGCADDENALTPPITPAPVIQVHRGGEHASYLDLPVIPAAIETSGPINAVCPRSGKPVAEDSLAEYRGYVVGFCNSHCRDDFAANAEERPGDRRFFDAYIAGLDSAADGD